METTIVNKVPSKVVAPDPNLIQNAKVLEAELSWLSLLIQTRIAIHFEQDTPYQTINEIVPPNLQEHHTPYAAFVKEHHLKTEERLALILALVPHLKPEVLDILSSKNKDYDRRFSEFGGLFLEGHAGLVPTAETAMFLLVGDNLSKRLQYYYLFEQDSLLVGLGCITGHYTKNNGPLLSKVWMTTNAYAAHLIRGGSYQTGYGPDFPAEQITTQLTWEDLIVSRATAYNLQEIRNWIKLGQVVLQDLNLGKRLKPGYKSLFFGPPGTGKSMAAALLGKSTQKPVYKIDLSMVVSKYIGETEKNLGKVFDEAQKYDWILFFDEADSLFGQRTQVNSANDRYGNQEIGYLLQRIEDFPGVVILASNLKDNIDEAFTRRFQSMIAFKMPEAKERYRLWQQSFSDKLPLDPSIDLWRIAEKYEISGGLMMNVVRKCTLHAVTHQEETVPEQSLESAIQHELQKEGIILN